MITLELYKKRVSSSKFPQCRTEVALKVCTCTPLNLLGECSSPMACAVILPEGCLKITWNARGLKVYGSPPEMLSGNFTTAVLGNQNHYLFRGEEGKRLEKSRKYSDFDGTHQATEKQCTNSQFGTCLKLKPMVIRYLILETLLPIWSSQDLSYNTLCPRSPGDVGPEAVLQQILWTTWI